jgi:hypothetical protein
MQRILTGDNGGGELRVAEFNPLASGSAAAGSHLVTACPRHFSIPILAVAAAALTTVVRGHGP